MLWKNSYLYHFCKKHFLILLNFLSYIGVRTFFERTQQFNHPNRYLTNAGDSRRETILDTIGGENHADTLSALLGYWSSYEQLLSLYSQEMENAAKEAEQTANSWDGSLNRLSKTWTDAIGNIANSDVLIIGIIALNELLGILNGVTDALGSLGSIGLGAGLFAGVKNVDRTKMFALI